MQLKLEYVCYLALLGVALIGVSCLKWRLFLRAGGDDAPLLRLMRLYTIAYFVNTFTPSYIGGDVVRSYHLGVDLRSQKKAALATVLERFTGLLAMCILGIVSVLVGTNATRGLELSILSVGIVAVFIAAACFSERTSAFVSATLLRILRLFRLRKLTERAEVTVAKVNDAFSVVRGDMMLFLKAMALSFIYHCLTVANTYVAACSIGWCDADFGGLFVAVPLVLLVGMAPITPSGLGLQEGAFLFFLKRIGGTDAQALAVGVVLRVKVLIIGLIGGLLWSGLKRNVPTPHKQ